MDEHLAAELVNAAFRLGTERGEQVCVALVDTSGHLLTFTRSPRAAVPAIDLTIGKAYTAATLGLETPALRELTAPGGPLEGLLAAVVSPRPLAMLPGGVPVVRDGAVVAGLGVGGSASPQADHEIALAALAATSPTAAGAFG